MPSEVIKISDEDTKHLAINFKVETTHKPGAVRLDQFPLLTYAPMQHGDGIRIENNGTTVAEIAAKAAEMPDYQKLADHFHTTVAHIREAIDYAVKASTSEKPAAKPGV